MTYDPNRYPNPNDPYENPYRVSDAERRTGSGAAFLLGALLLAAIGGFIYFTATGERSTVANNEIRPPITQPANPAVRPAPPETTGSAASNSEPAPQTPPANPQQQ